MICRIPTFLFLSSGLLFAEPPVPEKIEFNRDVRPILSNNCFYCHGPDKEHREAKLRLDIRESALKVKAFIPGNTKDSELVYRILTDDEDDLMPPPDSHKKLTARDKDVLKRWIEQGAEYKEHWAYIQPVKPPGSAAKNSVDVLVDKRLAEIGFKPSPEADRRILARRLYSDLIGLLPTPAEVAAFVNDKAPDAYEKLVERLLANPHHGERMAIGWLDVVRFADTIGYHSDNPHSVWPYRDWVIRAFNENKRFDRFTIEQLAGDLLPDATTETRIGSAFNRLLLTTEEGGAQPKDYEARMLADRVRAVGTVWLGQTIGCAQCHDHKFDPITARDFYQLGAFFADIQEGLVAKREAGMPVVTPEQEKQLADLTSKLAEAKKNLDALLPKLDADQREWEVGVAAGKIVLPELAQGAKAPKKDRQAAEQLLALVKKEIKARKPKEKQTLQTHFRSKVTKVGAAEQVAFTKAEKEHNAYNSQVPKCLVSISSANKRTVRILPRGDFMNEDGEMVKPAVPHYLPQPAVEGRDLNRLDLAQWLVSRDNPLTARTVMNRMWEQFFGTGLSKILSDLGAQGEPPVNPELLDWLACEFMDSGWDMRHMIRIMVTSRAYRRVSTVTPALEEADPFNREIARQSRFRADAELIRDQALSVAGLLVPKIGGPSVKPYQPDGYWSNLNFPARTYDADKGEGQYRRGLYVWWQRSFVHPSMLAFDAPTREECAAERNQSNIPQQALALLNDPTYVEAARSFAARILASPAKSPAERIAWAWQQALQRDPDAEEMKTVLVLVEQHLADYQKDPAAAGELLKTGFAPLPPGSDPAELAAWTHAARVLLNLHEVITRS